MLSLLALPGAAAPAVKSGCLMCHKPHYADRGSCVSCHRGDGRSDRLAIAHRDLISGKYSWFTIAGSRPLMAGEKLLEIFACRRCHAVAGKGNSLAINLDRLPPNTTPQQIYDAIKSPTLVMPEFRFSDRQITEMVNGILAGAERAGYAGGETPQVVHFEMARRRQENVFEKQCGPCHKALTETRGALGKGIIGPNLSGLFSGFYPATAASAGKPPAGWTSQSLKKWLDNPRKIRELSQMRPVLVKQEGFDQLLVLLAVKKSAH